MIKEGELFISFKVLTKYDAITLEKEDILTIKYLKIFENSRIFLPCIDNIANCIVTSHCATIQKSIHKLETFGYIKHRRKIEQFQKDIN